MAYNHGREDRKWRIWKEAEEKLLRECGVDEATFVFVYYYNEVLEAGATTEQLFDAVVIPTELTKEPCP